MYIKKTILKVSILKPCLVHNIVDLLGHFHLKHFPIYFSIPPVGGTGVAGPLVGAGEQLRLGELVEAGVDGALTWLTFVSKKYINTTEILNSYLTSRQAYIL